MRSEYDAQILLSHIRLWRWRQHTIHFSRFRSHIRARSFTQLHCDTRAKEWFVAIYSPTLACTNKARRLATPGSNTFATFDDRKCSRKIYAANEIRRVWFSRFVSSLSFASQVHLALFFFWRVSNCVILITVCFLHSIFFTSLKPFLHSVFFCCSSFFHERSYLLVFESSAHLKVLKVLMVVSRVVDTRKRIFLMAHGQKAIGPWVWRAHDAIWRVERTRHAACARKLQKVNLFIDDDGREFYGLC